jgi:hypothetical protein
LDAFAYYLDNPPQKKENKPVRFTWLNLYIPEIDALNPKTNKRVQIKLDDLTIQNRIRDTKQQWSFVRVYYYYITGGRVLFDYEYVVHQGKYTKISNSTTTPPDLESVIPYPSDLLYQKVRQYDGVMWWHPSYPGVSYLGGPRFITFVPGILDTKGWKLGAIMPLGASFKVLIHEIFHSYAHQLGIDSGHNWLLENKSKWIAGYQKIMQETQTEGKASELSWYEILLRDEGNAKDHSKIFNRLTLWVPSEKAFRNAKDFYKKAGAKNIEECRKIQNQANQAFALKKADEGIKLLKKGLSLVPDHPVLLYLLALQTHWMLQKRDEAQKIYDQYLEKYSDFTNSDIVLVYTLGYYLHRNPEKVLSLLNIHGKNPPDHHKLSEYKLYEVKALALLKKNAEAKAKALEFLDDEKNMLKEQFREFIKGLK